MMGVLKKALGWLVSWVAGNILNLIAGGSLFAFGGLVISVVAGIAEAWADHKLPMVAWSLAMYVFGVVTTLVCMKLGKADEKRELERKRKEAEEAERGKITTALSALDCDDLRDAVRVYNGEDVQYNDVIEPEDHPLSVMEIVTFYPFDGVHYMKINPMFRALISKHEDYFFDEVRRLQKQHDEARERRRAPVA